MRVELTDNLAVWAVFICEPSLGLYQQGHSYRCYPCLLFPVELVLSPYLSLAACGVCPHSPVYGTAELLICTLSELSGLECYSHRGRLVEI